MRGFAEVNSFQYTVGPSNHEPRNQEGCTWASGASHRANMPFSPSEMEMPVVPAAGTAAFTPFLNMLPRV